MKKLLFLLGCLCSAAIAIASPPSYVPPGTGPTVSPPSYVSQETGSTILHPEGSEWSNPDWLSSDVDLITYYGPYGYPTAVRFFDDRMFYDEWYPVARSFLDGTTYRMYYQTYYYAYHQPIYLDGSWWKDPRGYRPLYRIRPGFVFKGESHSIGG